LLHHRITGLGALIGVLLAAAATLGISACGSSAGGNAQTLLRQTFSGEHKVTSGNLYFTIDVKPSGSSTLTQPISLSFGGPFQSLGTGKLPESNFTVSITAQGHTGSLAIVSTGTKGFVTLSGVSYQLPAASFQKLESSFSSIASSGSGSGSKPGTLAKLGIQPLHWLSSPSVVGTETVGGASTTHIRATINMSALLADLNTFLQKASSLGVSGASKIPSSLSSAEQTKIAGEVRDPSFDVWTGNSDKTIRKLSVGLTLPVSGQISTLLGGLNSAAISLTLQYSDLNQPQTITAPTDVQPYSVFSQKLAGLLEEVEAAVESTSSTGSGGTSTTGSGGTSSTGAAGATNAYSRCIESAAGDVSKMQKCASLLNGSGG
jgi:hypothetical protein